MKFIAKIFIGVVVVLVLLIIIFNFTNPIFYYDHFINDTALQKSDPSVCYKMLWGTTNIFHPFFYLALFDSGVSIDRESCITDIASKLGDFSICNKNFQKLPPENNIGSLSGCYIHVSVANEYNYNKLNKGTETCLEIDSSYILSKIDCILNFAESKKDISICNLMPNQTPYEVCKQNTPNAAGCGSSNKGDSYKEICKNLVYPILANPVSKNLQVLTDKEHGFQIAYPKDWHLGLTPDSRFDGEFAFCAATSAINGACYPVFSVNVPDDSRGISLYILDANKVKAKYGIASVPGVWVDYKNNKLYELSYSDYIKNIPGRDVDTLRQSAINQMISSFRILNQ